MEKAPVVESAPAVVERPVHVLALSARTPDALGELVAKYREHLATSQDRFEDVCFTANAGRAHFAHRLAVVASSKSEAIAELGKATPAHRERAQKVRIAFLFTGQGSEYSSMGRELYESSPVFRAALERCDKAVPVLDALYGSDAELIQELAKARACLFAIEYGLAELWRHWGAEPSFVMGHGAV